MGSSNCNLKCTYCYINKNCSFSNYDKIIRKAWENEEYLDTVQKVLSKMGQDPRTITDFQLWGGEPTLHMPLIAKNGAKLGKMFPNINHFLIPTNWYCLDIKALVDFIYDIGVNLNFREKSEEYLNFHIQCSIDGPPGDFTKYGHDVDWNIYQQNFDKFCEYVQTKGIFQNVNIVFAICPTASQEIILKNLNTYDKISSFKEHVQKVIDYVLEKTQDINNVQIILSNRFMTPRMAISQTTTLEEAVAIQPMVRMLEYCNFEKKINIFEHANEIQSFRNVQAEQTYLQRNHECPESNEQALTIMPDGTIAECPCTFLQNLDSYRQELLDNKEYWEYKSALIRMPNFYNPLEENQQADDYHNWYVYGGYLGTNSTYANLNLSMGYEMALSHQIDPIYKTNPDLLIKHYLADFMTAECYREHVNLTHNHFLADHNVFRRWFNGYTEYGYNNHLDGIKQEFKKILEKHNGNDLSELG